MLQNMSTPASNVQRGVWGEEMAAGYLRDQGMVILHHGYRCPRGEIDLICRDHEYLVFVEVKLRSTLQMGYPEEAVTSQKRRRLVRAAQHFINEHRLHRVPVRFDVVAIRGPVAGAGNQPEIVHYPNAFGVSG